MNEFHHLAVLGAGSWGTALAIQAARASSGRVELVCRRQEQAAELARNRRNLPYLPEATLPEEVFPIHSSELDFSSLSLLLIALPSTALRAEMAKLQGQIQPQTLLVSCTKGIEADTGLCMSEILHELFPSNAIAVLSGPNHAEEISTQRPCASVIGCEQENLAKAVQERLSSANFRLYRSQDVRGMELGGALKNVYALAAGMAAGLQLGDNARAALLTRALAEMKRLGVALGGQKDTFSGLSGVGDLMATAYSEHSRNFRTGRLLGQGKSLQEAIQALKGMICEGIPTAKSSTQAAKKAGIDCPLLAVVQAVIAQEISAQEALHALLSRDLRAE